MPRILLRVQYDGANYFGWQRQIDDQPSVQAVVEAAIRDLFQEPVKILGAGRTDRGVSARGMPAHFNVETRLRGEELRRAIDVRLPADVSIRSAEVVADDFHCRYHTCGKCYAYRLLRTRKRAPLVRFAYFWPKRLDMDLLRRAGAPLIGTHDFSSFATMLVEHENRQTTQPDPDKPDKPQGNIRTLYDISVVERGEIVTLLLFGDGFLRGMVRSIVGTILDVASKGLDPSVVGQILAAKDRREAGPNLPAHGLMLERVFYDDAERETWQARAKAASIRDFAPSGVQWPEELY